MIEIGQKWRHKERGSVYEILDPNSRVQCSSVEGSMQRMLEAQIWVSYRDVHGAPFPTCFRMRDEFLDGRFELVEDVT
jgi:hypothetical protein